MKKGISGSTIKIIAIIAMLIDHIAATVMTRYAEAYPDVAASTSMGTWIMVMRLIGRFAFPLFIFLLVEGFEHTKNQWKYLGRLTVFGLLSEIPIDMAFTLSREEVLSGKLIEFTYQNVFFTLAIGLLCIILIRKTEESEWNIGRQKWVQLLIMLAGMYAAYVLRTDYSLVGVLAIIVMYMYRYKRVQAMALTCVALTASSLTELTAFLMIIPVRMYNGERGLPLKYVFYAFYPLHLLALAAISIALGV